MLHKPWLLLIYFGFLDFFSKGIPDQPALGGCLMKLPPDLLPEATNCYHWQVGSTLTHVSLFCCFPQWNMKQRFNKNAIWQFLNFLTVLLTMNQDILKHATKDLIDIV